jgi:hypothetical protein
MTREHTQSKRNKLPILLFSLLIFILLIASCNFDYEPDPNTKIFDYQLQGTWKSNDYDNAVYKGTLTIAINYITITGYSETQTPPLGSDNNRPFKTITKGTPLKAYSEEGNIYIEDGGTLQTGIPYTYWDDYPPPDYKRKQFLRFTFGDRQETLQKDN